jgi:hypothetical protein
VDKVGADGQQGLHKSPCSRGQAARDGAQSSVIPPTQIALVRRQLRASRRRVAGPDPATWGHAVNPWTSSHVERS